MKTLYLIPIVSLALSCSFTSSEFTCEPGDTQTGKICKDGIWIVSSEPKDASSRDDTNDGGTTDPDSGSTPDMHNRPDATPDVSPDLDPAICGNGTVEDGEECDGIPPKSCQELGFVGGDVICEDCLINTDQCEAAPDCGNGELDQDEQCDGGKLGGKTCTDVQFDGGTLACTNKCVFDSSACYKCGDGTKDPGEDCDGTDFGNEACSADGVLTCTNTCQIEKDGCFECGNDTTEQTEICDGSDVGGQTCTSQDATLSGKLLCATDCSGYDLAECRPFFTQVSGGEQHTCGRKSDGSVVCWGSNADGKRDNIPTGRFKYVGAGDRHTCGLLESGEIRCWGNDSDNRVSNTPMGTFTQLSVGLDHTCALTTAGTITCWGDNGNGRATPPTGIFEQISVMEGHGCAVAAGVVSCWGRFGDGRNIPDNLPAAASVRVGRRFTCGLMVSGAIRCWGDNARINAPLGTYSQVDTQRYHSCAIDSISGFASCWGSNNDGRSTPPGRPVSYSQIGLGNAHTCAVRMDGEIDCWGSNANGKASPPLF